MKVAMIGQKGFPAIWGGVEEHVDQLTRGLATQDMDVVVYTRPQYTSRAHVDHWNESEQEHQHIQLVSIPTVPTKHLEAIVHTFFSLMHAVVVTKPDVYHIHSVGPSLLAWIPRVVDPSATVIATFHSPDRLHQKWNWFARFMLLLGEWCAVHCAHETITVSKDLQRYAQERYGKELTMIPNGVCTPTIQKPSMISAAFGLEGNDYFLVVSRLVRHKGIHDVIDAYKRIATDKKLVIVGDSVHTDDYVNELHRQAGDHPQIIFTGFQHGRMLEELFSNASATIHASTSEGMSLALMEAASYGSPIIASDIPENTEVLGDTVEYFPVGDSEALAQHMVTVELHPADAVAQAKVTRQWVLNNFHWDHIVARTRALYTAAQGTSEEPIAAPRQAR